MEEISLSIAKFNIHALIIIGGFEVSDSNWMLCLSFLSTAPNIRNNVDDILLNSSLLIVSGICRRSADSAG